MDIKYDKINLIGMELFRKNNDTFLKSNLSTIMSRIFKAANSPFIVDIDSEYYMKSGSIPNRIFYIYSQELVDKNPTKIYDIVQFNNEECIWFYSTNAISMIDKDPVNTIIDIYDTLINVFMPTTLYESFINVENFIAKIAMSLNLMLFLNDTYGVLDIDKCKEELITNQLSNYTIESARDFINDIETNCNNSYFHNREYLESYLLLKKKPEIIYA